GIRLVGKSERPMRTCRSCFLRHSILKSTNSRAWESAELAVPDVCIIDTSTAHRTNPDWAYGFPELSKAHREAIAAGKRIAGPGCHAGGFIATVYPLVACGLLPKDTLLTCNSITGYSGGGRKMIEAYRDGARPEEYLSPRQYGMTQVHKHLPEMQVITGLTHAPAFSPIVADFYAGMVVTVPVFAEQMTGCPTLQTVREAMADHYAGQKLVKVINDETPKFYGANALAGHDSMEIRVDGNDRVILLTARFDNLGKGASGAAVQCMNIAMGLDETEGLNP
ncbi:MAG: N-acetyl-gamma-glutamyl-phosphate reductase, partial [Clostridia bacterium]|nr:N-acetyl-gamma-glutamyl-phosphate reductase [Clostridia bacterium]